LVIGEIRDERFRKISGLPFAPFLEQFSKIPVLRLFPDSIQRLADHVPKTDDGKPLPFPLIAPVLNIRKIDTRGNRPIPGDKKRFQGALLADRAFSRHEFVDS
jgi:hypothetical protein